MEEKVVCVLNPDVKYQLEHYCDVDATGLVTPYEMQDLKDNQGAVIPALNENVLLSKHPYKNEWFELNEKSEDKIVLDRIENIMTILSYLGAKYCRIKSTSLQLNDGRWDFNGSIMVEAPKGSGKVSGDLKESTHSMQGNTVGGVGGWPGTYTVAGYNRAKEIAYASGLASESTIASLLEERNPLHPNPRMQMSYSIDVRSDLETMKAASIKLEAKIKAAKIGIALEGSYGRTSCESRHNTFDFEAEFGPLEISESEKEEYRSSTIKNGKPKKYWPIIVAAVVVVIAVVVWFVLT